MDELNEADRRAVKALAVAMYDHYEGTAEKTKNDFEILMGHYTRKAKDFIEKTKLYADYLGYLFR